MPHQCVRCGKIISDGSKELLTGCKECGSRFFFYIRNDNQAMNAKLVRDSLTAEEVNEMEKDVRKLMSAESSSKPVILDIETIRTDGPGKFRIDISALMRGEPVIINISDGKYYIDLPSAFNKGSSAELLKHLKN